MKGLSFCFALLAVVLPFAAADETGEIVQPTPPNNGEYQNTPVTYLSLMYDPGFTMRSGAEDIVTVHGGISRLEDSYIKTRWLSERTLLGKGAGMLCRFAKYYFVDVSVDYFAAVFSHEYFGHGARYREFEIGEIYYRFDWPPPYGAGGGEATASIGPGVISMQELTAILAGGIEAHSTMMNHVWALRWTAKREMTYREASAYFWSWQIMFDYVQGTEDALASVVDGNDITNYVMLLNEHAGSTDPDSLLMDIKYLKDRTYLSLVNPYLVYSLYAMLKTYLLDGSISTGFPMLKIGGIEYLPCFRIGWAPFGIEYHMENFLKVHNKVVWLDLRIGDETFYQSWGGVGMLVKNIYESNRLSLDVRLDVWKQPEIELGDPRVYKGGGTGGAFSVRMYYSFGDQLSALAAVLEAGYKSPGFLEGYYLDSSPIVMLGLAVRN
ncbi:MAG: hypothetical protein JSW02_03955 [candidate division WOR-3 bacterium]|nr:MAG: hypothetical protein JSW02_03955 [candidate division WOR-3 bacterium]